MNETETLNLILEELKRINQNLRQPAITGSAYLTIEQVSEAMRCSENTVRSWITSGQLPVFKYKATVRVRAEVLERFIKRFSA